MSVLLRLFPATWRARYGEEFLALLEDQPPGRRRWLDITRCLVAAHLDRSAPPSLEPTPLSGKALTVAFMILGLASAGLSAVFLGAASHSALQRAVDLIEPLVIIAPVAIVLAVLWAYRRDADRTLGAALPAVAADAFLFTVIGLVAVVTLRPQLGFFDLPAWIELRPFHDVLTASTDAGRSEAIAIIAGNVSVFTVFGFALTLRRARPRYISVVAIAVSTAVVLEVGQAVLGTGRPSDMTDVMSRAVGASLGYAAWRLPWTLFRIPRTSVRAS